MKAPKIALVFDWLTVAGGAEKVNLELHKIFPEAPIFTSIYNSEKVKGFENANIQTSFIQKLPFAKKRHQLYLSLMPQAYENFDLSNFDIVISSSHSCAKGILTKPETLHISYCHSPMRYAWGDWQKYIKEYKMNPLIKFLAKKQLHKIRIWDKVTADRVDYFIANSTTTAQRISKFYRRNSEIIFPPVNIENFKINEKTEGFFLAVGRLIPYKKFDLTIEAFKKLQLPLKIVGTGVAENDLKELAKNHSNIEFLGSISDKKLKTLYSQAEALIFPQLEDFGITPLESMASGRPVIAYRAGGALDTIIENKTGIFFDQQTPEALMEAVLRFQNEKGKFNPTEIHNHAQKFDNQEFAKNVKTQVLEKWHEFQENTLKRT